MRYFVIVTATNGQILTLDFPKEEQADNAFAAYRKAWQDETAFLLGGANIKVHSVAIAKEMQYAGFALMGS